MVGVEMDPSRSVGERRGHGLGGGAWMVRWKRLGVERNPSRSVGERRGHRTGWWRWERRGSAWLGIKTLHVRLENSRGNWRWERHRWVLRTLRVRLENGRGRERREWCRWVIHSFGYWERWERRGWGLGSGGGMDGMVEGAWGRNDPLALDWGAEGVVEGLGVE